MSFSTTRDSFYQDQAKCNATCGSEARLFFHPTHGGTMDDAVDLSGRPYIALKTAFRFRKALVEGCTCRPPPWSETELARHQSYAAAETASQNARPFDPKTPGAAALGSVPPEDTAKRAAETTTQDPKATSTARKWAQAQVDGSRERLSTTDAQSGNGKLALRHNPRGNVSGKAVATTARLPVRYVEAPSSGGGLFGPGGVFSMGLGAKPKYTWPGDPPARRQ